MKKPTEPTPESREEMPEIDDQRFRRRPGRGHHSEHNVGDIVSCDTDLTDHDSCISYEEVKTRLAARMVGTMAIRGDTHAAIRAEYPHVLDEDIELARRLVASSDPLLTAVDADRFRHRDADKPIVISDFDRWVNDNNIPETFEYSKGWWDYVELVRLFASRLDTEDISVVGHYFVDTPPPCERLPMPAVAISTSGLTVALRYDFGSWSLKHDEVSEWVVSVERRSPYRGPLFGLFDENLDLRTLNVDGLAPKYLFGSYRQDPARFSCLLRDEWDVATLLRIVAHEL